MRTLLAIPVYNEQRHVTHVLEQVRRYVSDVLVVDDGSNDDTPLLLARQPVEVIRHATNRGYGRSLIDAFRWAGCYRYDWLITMDCDEQHEPASLPDFLAAMRRNDADVISGSRYLDSPVVGFTPPPERRAINQTVTRMVNECLGLHLTDAFCGFKAYRVSAIKRVALTEPGYAFPLQFWVQAVARGLRIVEVPVPLIYNDPNRSFGARLDDARVRLAHYREVFEREMVLFPDKFPDAVGCGACANCGGAAEPGNGQSTQ